MIEIKQWGWGWLALCCALALHVFDEAINDFLSVYNPTVLAIQEKLPYLPIPTFDFSLWLTGLIVAILLLFVLSPYAFQNKPWMRKIAYIFAIIMIGNGILHILGSIYSSEIIPGIYSSPILLLASTWLLVQLRLRKNNLSIGG